KKLGINEKDIQTQNYRVSPEYDYSSPERRITGYRVNTEVVVKITDFEKLNQIIDTATGLGANQVGGISFSLSEKKQAELKKEARKEAIAEAKDSAEELAKLAGIKLERVINVTESDGNNYPQPMYARAEMALGGARPEEPTQIEPGSEIYRYSVTLSYETL
ncbi:SIMPL domain-containing protein, partial [Patescibacteria group bacterium]|nr:SIMPL domain-containing protein [Patescibacteria group bacterium]